MATLFIISLKIMCKKSASVCRERALQETDLEFDEICLKTLNFVHFLWQSQANAKKQWTDTSFWTAGHAGDAPVVPQPKFSPWISTFPESVRARSVSSGEQYLGCRCRRLRLKGEKGRFCLPA